VKEDLALRLEIDALYARSSFLLDEGPLAEWPSLFVENAVYRAVTDENNARGWALALMHCDSRAAIEDRVYAIENLSLTIPRRVRHLYSGISITPEGADFRVGANFAIFETIAGAQTVAFAAGRYRDVITRVDGALKFKERIAICDSALVRNSLVFPL
jgi:anthranilate 1,2-dioxygenase small subunit